MIRPPHRPLVLRGLGPGLRPALVVAAFAAGALFGACSDGTADPGPTADAATTRPPSQVTTTSTTKPTPRTPEQEVEAAYVAAFTAYFRAGEAPSRPEKLDSHFSGAALSAVRNNIGQMNQNGIVSDYSGGDPEITVETIFQPVGSKIVLVSCTIDSGRQIETATGEVVDEEPVSRRSEATLMFTDHWRVTEHRTVEQWSNMEGCK